MVLNNKYLKRKKGAKDLEMTILGEKYFINPKMLPFIAARVYKDNSIYAFIVINKRGVAQFLRPGDTLAILQICKFRNASTKDELAKNPDIPSCMVDDNNNFYPMQNIKEVYGNTSAVKVVKPDGKKVDATVNSDIQQAGDREARSFVYSDDKKAGSKLGYKERFSMEATVPESLYPIIESKYVELKSKYKDKFNVSLKVIGRHVDKEKQTATVTFRIEGAIKSPEWVVLGTIYHNDDKTIVSPMVTVSQETLDKMYKLPCKCDICEEKRNRIKTYYLQNLKDRTKFIQAATHCMDKVIGVDELAAASGFEDLLKLTKPDELVKYSGEGVNYFNSIDLFATTALYKYYSCDDIASHYIVGCYEDLDDKYKEEVDGAIQWIKGLDSSIPLFRNVQTLLSCNNTHKRFITLFKKILTLYDSYCKFKKKSYDNCVEGFNSRKEFITEKIAGYEKTRARFIRENAELDKELLQLLKVENERREAENREKRREYEAEMDEYDRKVEEEKRDYEDQLAAYDEYTALKDNLSKAELLQLEQELAKKYNLKSGFRMREFKSETWINVRVKEVTLKLVMNNQYGEGKVGPYVFTTDEGFKVSWFTQLDKAEELGLPQDKGEVVELDKVLRCKTKKYIEKYGELQVAYCKFVDSKPESLVDGFSLFDKEPEDKSVWIRKPKEPFYYDSASEQDIKEMMRIKGKRWHNIELFDLRQKAYIMAKESIDGVDPRILYNKKLYELEERFGSEISTLLRKRDINNDLIEEAKKIKSFQVESVLVLKCSYLKNYIIVYETNYGYVVEIPTHADEYFEDKMSGNVVVNEAYKFYGSTIKVRGVELRNCNITRVSDIMSEQLNDKKLYIITDKEMYFDGVKCK